ncbi:MAG: carotenoid biosynthesis protein [Tannerellaceae bacterium]|nr:carotenoid biosynthesis protein [Tannerellaceae bacterium]
MANEHSQLISVHTLPALFIRFYIVGYLLFIIPWARSWFVFLTPLSLLLVTGILFYYHKEWNIRTISWFLFIILSSFLLEMVGTSTGKIFGEYAYAEGLGWKVHQTPLIIGINWLFLVYSSRAIVSRQFHSATGRILSGAILMILYDALMEWVAPAMHMWQFTGGYPPASNFIAWFIAALVYHAGFEYLHIRTDNSPARWLFVTQWFFFLLIGIAILITGR